MKLLRELVQTINRVKVRAIRKLGFPFETDNQLGEMYELLLAGEEADIIALQLTGKSDKSGDFRRLKSDMADRLISSLFLIDLSKSSYNSRQLAFYTLHKNWAASKILRGKGARGAAADLANQTLRQARRYEFNDLAFDMSRSLRLHYGTVDNNRRKYQHYAQECDDLQRIVRAEMAAEDYYIRFISEMTRKKADTEKALVEAREAHASLQPLLTQYDAYSLHFYAGLMEMGIYTETSNYEAADEVCDRLIAFFEQKDYVASVPLQIAYLQKLICHFQLKKFAFTERFLSKGLELLQEGFHNWFKFQEIYLILALHTGEYEAAYRVFATVTGHVRFKVQSEETIEYWRIIEAYLYFLVQLDELPVAVTDKRFTKFRIGRFLNQIPIFSQDKRGVNVSILIIQILLLVVQKRYRDIHDRMDAIEQYGRRHLFTKDTMRSFYFLKALLELPRNSFHRAAVKRRSAKYLQKMRVRPLEEAGQRSFITEIVPFDHLWEHVITFLDNDFH